MTALAADDSLALRALVIATARAMNAAHINVNKSGNVSARAQRGGRSGFVVTPTALPYAELTDDDLVFVDLDGRATGARTPSSEWRIHRDVYRARPELAALVHTHSPQATALACHGRGLPPFHYMVAAGGGPDIRCAGYATYGTQALSSLALAALEGRRACLLAHHGVLAAGATLAAALALAIEVEHLAGIYLAALALGEPPTLPADEMARVLEAFGQYGAGA